MIKKFETQEDQMNRIESSIIKSIDSYKNHKIHRKRGRKRRRGPRVLLSDGVYIAILSKNQKRQMERYGTPPSTIHFIKLKEKPPETKIIKNKKYNIKPILETDGEYKGIKLMRDSHGDFSDKMMQHTPKKSFIKKYRG